MNFTEQTTETVNFASPPPKLDKWDCQIISIWKRSKTDILGKCLKVWGDRVGMDEDYPDALEYINEHFLLLAQKLGLFNNEYRFNQFIQDLNSEHNWKYICSKYNKTLDKNTKDFQIILFSRLDSLFSHTEVKDLPGFVCDYSFDD